ncbi:serine hydrolase [Anaerococcus jeddahensis]|uniref:serine hydrolase n=1 Tax=Anaerococcus jeddahensis TaxID=1673719 RepID=UPI0006724B67|nr:serine hydrolase [Anaerococcus jeddahensis]
MKKNIKILISIFIAIFISTFAFTLKVSKSEKVYKNKKVVGFKSDKYLNKIENLYKSDEDLDENIVKNKTKNTKEEKSSNNDELSKEIEKIIDEECQNLEGDWQVAVDSLKGDSKVSIFKNSNPQKESLPAASTIKFFIALEAYRQVEEGILDEKNVENDIYLMLRDSNNESANRLIDLIGNNDMNLASQNLGSTIKKITGENKTGLYRKMLHDGKENIARANDLNMGLRDIYLGKFVNRDHSNKLMKAMAENNSTSNFKLLGKLPKEAKGLSKSGEIPNKGVENDIAIIGVNDEVFAISFLSQYPNPVNHGSGPQFDAMQNLGKRISETFIKYNINKKDS